MDRIPIEDAPDAVEEPMIQAKKAEDTEFAFRLPPGMEQQMGMLNSMLGARGGGGGGNMFDQLLKGVQNPGKTGATNQQAADSNNNPQQPGQPNRSQQSDMAGKMFEQSLGMIGSMLNKGGGGGGGGGGADILGSLFGGGQSSHKKQQEPEPNKMYPKLDEFQEDKPPKPRADPASQLNIESFLNQGMDKLGLDDVFGNILGKPKKPETPQVYPNLDDVQGAKPSQHKSEQIDLEKIINQGIDVIGSALKGNAGNVLGQFLKSNVSAKPNNSSPRTDVPESGRPEPNKSTYEPAAPPPSAAAAAAARPQAPEPVKMPEAPKPQPPKEHHDKHKSKEESADDQPSDIIDSIPEDAFIEAFDKLI